MTRTDYNDGEIHVWRGGQECPVHPESIVSVASGTWGVIANFHERLAGDLIWSCIFAFRVIRPYVEPREGWVVPGQLYDSARQAKIAHPGVDPIRVKEVKE